MTEPASALATVAARIDALPSDRPVRVAVDGVTAAGKTTFADPTQLRYASRADVVVENTDPDQPRLLS